MVHEKVKVHGQMKTASVKLKMKAVASWSRLPGHGSAI
jgi:hypothetical protein